MLKLFLRSTLFVFLSFSLNTSLAQVSGVESTLEQQNFLRSNFEREDGRTCSVVSGRTYCGYNCEYVAGRVYCGQSYGATCNYIAGRVYCGVSCEYIAGRVYCAQEYGEYCSYLGGRVYCGYDCELRDSVYCSGERVPPASPAVPATPAIPK